MPVNSFENYPMSWLPNRASLFAPLYISLAKQLEQDIQNGKLAHNTKLPPQRELADYLDVSLSTVTRAYLLCTQKGLVRGRTGSGTYVCFSMDSPRSVLRKPDKAEQVQMGTVYPLYAHNHIVSKLTAELLQDDKYGDLYAYGDYKKNEKHLSAAKEWMDLFRLDKELQNIVFTSGAQNALAVTLSTLFSAGDIIATDAYTYANFIGLAGMLGIRLISVLGDENGMKPELLEKACSNIAVKGVYLVTSCSNPFSMSIPFFRKKELAEVIARNSLLLIEDGIYSFLEKEMPLPMSILIPNQSIYINSVSKSVCAGLRVGYIGCSPKYYKALELGSSNCNLKVSTLNFETASELILRKMHTDIMTDKRSMSLVRNAIFDSYFPGAPRPQVAATYFRWLPLPKGTSGKTFEKLAEQNGVQVLGAERFDTNHAADHCAVRLAICSPATTDLLCAGLEKIKKLISEQEK